MKTTKQFETIESRFLTTSSGKDILVRSAICPDVNESKKLKIISYLFDKYSSKELNNRDSNEFIQSIKYGSLAEETMQNSELIVGVLSGTLFQEYFPLLDPPQASTDIIKYLTELKQDKPELYLNIISVDGGFKGKGIGSKILGMAEYLFALDLLKNNKNDGFVCARFCPFDSSKEKQTLKFYKQNGYQLFGDFELYKPINAEEVYDKTCNELDFII